MLKKILSWLRLTDAAARAQRVSPEDLARLARREQVRADADRRRSEAWDTQWRNDRRS
jgi:hypothetical protein